MGKRTFMRVVRAMSHVFMVPPTSIIGSSRTRRLIKPRACTIYVARQEFGYSYPELGDLFGKHHSSIMYLQKKAEAWLEANDDEARGAIKYASVLVRRDVYPISLSESAWMQ